MERQCVSPKEVAALTGLAVKTIYNLHSAGRMPASLPFGANVRWLASDIDAWIVGRRA